jgi:hypothetical protein
MKDINIEKEIKSNLRSGYIYVIVGSFVFYQVFVF